MKVVINRCFGGFSLSKYALLWLEAKGFTETCYSIERHHPLLVECVETLGKDADGTHASLMVVEVKDKYQIEDNDGFENIITPELLMERIQNDHWISSNNFV